MVSRRDRPDVYSTLSAAGHMAALRGYSPAGASLYDILAALRVQGGGGEGASARRVDQGVPRDELWCGLGVVMPWWSEVSVSRGEGWRGVGEWRVARWRY